MAIIERELAITVRLAPKTGTNQPSTFAGTDGNDTVTVKGLRMVANVQNSGAAIGCTAMVKIFGLSPSLMNQFSTLGLVFNLVPRNTLTILAGDAGKTLSPVFTGTIQYAYGDYASQPDVSFTFECIAGLAEAVIPTPPQSFRGATSVESVMSGIARLMDKGFENNGVDIQLSNSYFDGTLMAQAQQCADDAPCEWGFVNGSRTLAIWPKGGSRNTPDIPVISPATGMISSPSFTQQGIYVKTVFNPKISFGSLIKVESHVLSGIAGAQKTAAANASIFPTQWAVNKHDLALSCKMPRGDWMSIIYAYNPGYAKGIQAPGQGR